MGGININILILYSTEGLHELTNSLHIPFWGVVSFHCPLPPSSGNTPEVQQMRAEEGVETGKKKKIEGKGIQTLFLEIVDNPPQLHHMTFPKEKCDNPPFNIGASRSILTQRCPQFPQTG